MKTPAGTSHILDCRDSVTLARAYHTPTTYQVAQCKRTKA